MSRQLTLFILIILSGCTDRKVFENKSENHKLILKNDSVYLLKYKTTNLLQYLPRRHNENGTYKIANGSILLKEITGPPLDSIIDCTFFYPTSYPDTVEFIFRNMNDSSICVNFTINNDSTIFKTDNSGHSKLLYKDLVSKKILSDDSTFYAIAIFYNNKNYFIKESSRYSISKPTTIEIKLNQFIGEKTAIWYSKYPYSNDSIIFTAKTWKGTSKEITLKRK